MPLLRNTIVIIFAILLASPASAQKKKPFIPRRQSKPPGPPLSPQDAIKKMKVPPGFKVELVASEPDIVNPVGLCFDERGRAWITESLEYPRRRPGKGRDRVKVLEDTNGDGKMDKATVVIEGLNIPSGVNVGYGGVWVANAPDILFYPFKDRDKPTLGKPQVVVTGFGRRDTHELPNSLTWGPDGWLYGLNGVFNHSHVRYGKGNPNFKPKHPGWKFTCAMFRIHPRTRKFEVFAEGTSNPWGIAFNNDGEAFISACVIDHLWHITETGYYHRQGGPYPPHTWKIGSIVKHKHQKAAYCGIHYYDSDAYPKEYRGHLYMGNIHGGCINVDTLSRDGSTYFAKPRPDFLTANDVWFMPVVQKTGPDGCLWILDWYDRYHCYQDANADPKGIDRLHGRLYRVRYVGEKSSFAPRKNAGAKSTSNASKNAATRSNALSRSERRRWPKFDLAKETDAQLIKRLHGGNALLRRLARRVLTERNNKATKPQLRKLVLDAKASRIARLNALWVLIGSGALDEKFHLSVMKHKDATFRAWAVRSAANRLKSVEVLARVYQLADDDSPIVQREVVIATRKIFDAKHLASVCRTVLEDSNKDKLLPHIVWNNLKPLTRENPKRLFSELSFVDFSKAPGFAAMMPFLADMVLDEKGISPGQLFDLVSQPNFRGSKAGRETAVKVLSVLNDRIHSGQITTDNRRLQLHLMMAARRGGTKASDPVDFQVMLMHAVFGSLKVKDQLIRILANAKESDSRRIKAARAIITSAPNITPAAISTILANPKANSANFRGKLLAELGRLKDDKVADVVLKNYGKLEPELQPRAVELLTQRVNWSKKLLAAVGKKAVPANAINLNQARRLLAFKNAELSKLVKQHWGVVRTTRDPKRAAYVAKWKAFLRKTPGDPFKGEKAFKKVCAQCHKIYGQGVDVGPDITRNGRNSFDQLLSNVFDPSLVIGSAYRAHTVATKKGRIITGLVVENSKQRIVLKVQGGKKETIARGDIEFSNESKLSMMPEDLEKLLKPQEIADLFAFLVLDKHPKDPKAARLPGTMRDRPRRRKRRR